MEEKGNTINTNFIVYVNLLIINLLLIRKAYIGLAIAILLMRKAYIGLAIAIRF
jgi:hypothetical protein